MRVYKKELQNHTPCIIPSMSIWYNQIAIMLWAWLQSTSGWRGVGGKCNTCAPIVAYLWYQPYIQIRGFLVSRLDKKCIHTGCWATIVIWQMKECRDDPTGSGKNSCISFQDSSSKTGNFGVLGYFYVYKTKSYFWHFSGIYEIWYM